MDDLIEPIISVLSLILFSIIIRLVLEFLKQRWAITFNKKQEFFGGQINIKNIKCRNFNQKKNIDDVSKIIMNN